MYPIKFQYSDEIKYHRTQNQWQWSNAILHRFRSHTLIYTNLACILHLNDTTTLHIVNNVCISQENDFIFAHMKKLQVQARMVNNAKKGSNVPRSLVISQTPVASFSLRNVAKSKVFLDILDWGGVNFMAICTSWVFIQFCNAICYEHIMS